MDSIDRWDDELLSMRLNSILSVLDSLLDVSSNLSNRFLLALLTHPLLKLLVQLLIGGVSPGNIHCFVVVISLAIEHSSNLSNCRSFSLLYFTFHIWNDVLSASGSDECD